MHGFKLASMRQTITIAQDVKMVKQPRTGRKEGSRKADSRTNNGLAFSLLACCACYDAVRDVAFP
jgi:hypothetical protein